jgi:chromosome segregation ATPase
VSYKAAGFHCSVINYFQCPGANKSVDDNDAKLPKAVVQEIDQLRQQIQFRDQLVAQLSSELFRMVKTYPPALPASVSVSSSTLIMSPSIKAEKVEAEPLREELRHLEQQIEFYQGQIDKRDVEITRLQKSCQVLSERNQLLEHVIQELPEIYRQKFTDRLDLVKSKVQSLQTENRRLSSELQQVNAQLPEAKSSAKRLSLPARPNTTSSSQPPPAKTN